MSEWGFIQWNSVTTQPFITIGIATYAASPWCARSGPPIARSPAINATDARTFVFIFILPPTLRLELPSTTTTTKTLRGLIGIAAGRIALLLQVFQRVRGDAEPFIYFLIRNPSVVVRSKRKRLRIHLGIIDRYAHLHRVMVDPRPAFLHVGIHGMRSPIARHPGPLVHARGINNEIVVILPMPYRVPHVCWVQ